MEYSFKLSTFREFWNPLAPQEFWNGKIDRKPYNYQVKNSTDDINTNYSWESMKKYIGEMLGIVNGVVLVSCKHEGDVYLAWTIIQNRNLGVMKLLYAQEDKIIDKYPKCEFDFYTIYQENKDITSFIDDSDSIVFPTVAN